MIVLNHGTLNHMNEENNIITLLARAVQYGGTAGGSDVMQFQYPDGVFVTNGVGSALNDQDLLRLGQQLKARGNWGKADSPMHPGVKDGREVQGNVSDYVLALQAYSGRYRKLPDKVDFIGYSRGAVTCFKMMNQESAIARLEGWENWKPYYRIFAIDPVPGITTEDNKHMWNDVEITDIRAMDKRTSCFILLAEGERRITFTPMLPRQARVKGNKDVCDYDTMPGVHIAMAGSEGHHTSPMFQLIKDMVGCYFDNYPFGNLRINTQWKKLDRYAEVVNGLDKNLRHGRGSEKRLFKETAITEGRKFHVPGQGPAPQPKGALGTGGRAETIRDLPAANDYQLRSNKLDKRSSSSPRGVVRVFVNTAHKKLCQELLGGHFDHFHQCDKGNWTKASREAFEQLTANMNVYNHKHVYQWIGRLIDEVRWQN